MNFPTFYTTHFIQVFEEIALQLCLQAERAVLEAAVEDAVMYTVLSSISAAEEGDESHFAQIEKTLAKKNVRWWGHELHEKKRLSGTAGPSFLLPILLSEHGSSYIAKNLPFDCEKDWFAQIENGGDEAKPENLTGSLTTHSTDIETPGSRVLCGEIEGADGPNRPQLPIISPEPRYNRISGFASRQQRQSMRMSISAAQMHSMLDTTTNSQGQAAMPERKRQNCPIKDSIFLCILDLMIV